MPTNLHDRYCDPKRLTVEALLRQVQRCLQSAFEQVITGQQRDLGVVEDACLNQTQGCSGAVKTRRDVGPLVTMLGFSLAKLERLFLRDVLDHQPELAEVLDMLLQPEGRTASSLTCGIEDHEPGVIFDLGGHDLWNHGGLGNLYVAGHEGEKRAELL